MFTGIVQDVGRVLAREPRGGDVRLTIGCERLDLASARVGDSLCVQGCCLTAIELGAKRFTADVSRETLALTTLGDLEPGAAVNLEPALPGLTQAPTFTLFEMQQIGEDLRLRLRPRSAGQR